MRIPATLLMLIGIAFNGFMADHNYDPGCWVDFPVKNGLLCYRSCKPNYSNYGGGPVCWATCPPETTNVGITCAKKNYGRGAGKPLSICGAGEEKSGLLCYPQCSSGYYGVGPVCWEHCKSGWTDQGALCAVTLHVYSRDVSSCPWYNKCGLFGLKCGKPCKSGYVNDGCTCRRPLQTVAKKSYGRGAGKPMQCAANEEQGGALCYPKCKSGYVGVGPVCWSTCSGETTDTGVFCQKKSYGRGVGKPLACLSKLNEAYAKKESISKLSDYLKNLNSKSLTKAVCLGIYAQARPLMKALSFIGSCSKMKSWNTVVFSISGSGSVLLTAGVEIGIAHDVKKNEAACYLQHCTGMNLDVSIGIAVNIGWFKSLEDIPGQSNSISFGVEVPGTEIGFTIASVTNPKGHNIGAVTSIGLGVGLSPLPFDIGGAVCNTPEDEMIRFTP